MANSNRNPKVIVMGLRKNPRKLQGPARRSAATGLLTHPPEIGRYEVTHSQVLRFTSAAAASLTDISFNNLLDTILITETAITAASLFNLVKVNWVKIWAIGALGTPVTTQVQYTGATIGQVGDFDIHTDTSMGVQPAFVWARPAKRSLVSEFQPGSANTAFNITCPAGSVIDVSISFRNRPGTLGHQAVAPAATTAGVVAFRGLDGLVIASTNFSPPTGIFSI